jgi:ferritin-like metal-binding protein YciE
MMQLAEMAVYLYERLQEYQQIKSLMDVPLWVEYRYTQQFLNTVDQIFKMTSSVARAKGMTEVTISAIVKVINDVITDPETKTILVAGLQKIAQA